MRIAMLLVEKHGNKLTFCKAARPCPDCQSKGSRGILHPLQGWEETCQTRLELSIGREEQTTRAIQVEEQEAVRVIPRGVATQAREVVH